MAIIIGVRTLIRLRIIGIDTAANKEGGGLLFILFWIQRIADGVSSVRGIGVECCTNLVTTSATRLYLFSRGHALFWDNENCIRDICRAAALGWMDTDTVWGFIALGRVCCDGIAA